MSNVHFLLIDPQNDFADTTGALSVPGAAEDMARAALFIERNAAKLAALHVTLDSHQRYHIANPMFWVNQHGDSPAPFTQITVKDVESGTWAPRIARIGEVLEYLQALESNGRYQHTIWPPHCIIGEWGHSMYPQIASAVKIWVRDLDDAYPVVDYVLKGSNPDTEHFSAIRAEVPNLDPHTQPNMDLIHNLESADRVLVAGIAGSHCVANTVRDAVVGFGIRASKFVLLTDTMSPVPGCEKLQADFIAEMVAKGAEVSTSEKFSLT